MVTRHTRRTHLRSTLALGALGGSAVGGLVTACGGAASPAAGDAPAASAQPVTIRFPDDTASPTDLAFAEEFAKRFNAKHAPKITAQLEAFPDPDWGKRYEKWVTMAVSGEMPQIVWLCCTFIRPFMMKGLVAELDRFIKRDWKQSDVDDFYKGPYEGMRVDGKQLGIPAYINTNIAFVNKNHLKEAGLAYPDENWDKNRFLDYVQKLTKPRGERWGYDMSFTAVDRNITWIWNHGGEPHDPKDGPVVTKLTYDNPKTIEGLQYAHDLIWKHQVSPKTNDDRGGLNAEDAFINGKTAIWMNASGSGAVVHTKAAGTGLDWDFLPLVKGPGGHGARISMDGYMIDKATKHQEQAWVVLRELASVETQELRATQSRRQPPRRSAAGAWERVYAGKNAKLGRIMADTARADPRSFWKDADQVGSIVGRHMTATFTRNEMTVPQAMRAAMDEVRGYYAGTK